MNEQLQVFARSQIKEGLRQCTKGQILVFKRMYSFSDLDLPVDTVVDNMPPEKLDWAMQQVQETLDKAAKT